ncbi:hypothetical protein BH10BDE1_BH10BDE1_07820 [soil metagenome]
MEFYWIELVSLWGTAIVGTGATLITVLTSKDSKLRKFAIFNLMSFLVTSLVLNFVINPNYPSFARFFSVRHDWVPLRGAWLLVYFLFADYIFYLYHRFTHTVPLFWTGHYSHHSGDSLHASLVIRDNVLSHIFLLPIGLLGIPLGLHPAGITAGVRLVIFYQAFMHFYTERDVPVLKYVFVTPYNHIIHHSTKFEGAGHNFGGILCIWDRICGTYREGAQYLTGFGLREGTPPQSLLQLNTTPMKELIAECRRNRSVKSLFLYEGWNFRLRKNWQTLLLYSAAVLLFVNLSVQLWRVPTP